MKKITILSILCVCVCVTVSAQTHDNNITPSTFFSGNFQPTKHFDAATFGLNGGHLFLGGSNGKKAITWNAMQSNSTNYRFMTTRSAAQMDYSHWNNLWRLKFSANSGAGGAPVTWQSGLSVQLTSGGDIEMRLCGSFYAQEININASTAGWCDYVFAPDYKLMSLGQLERYIQKNKHLPGVPSEKEVYDNGIAVTEMLQIQMKKIEELTLYTIQQQKEIEELRALLTAKD